MKIGLSPFLTFLLFECTQPGDPNITDYNIELGQLIENNKKIGGVNRDILSLCLRS